MNIESVLGASYFIHSNDCRGNAVAVTENKALTVLHGIGECGLEDKLIEAYTTTI